MFSPPIPSSSIFVGTCVYANISRNDTTLSCLLEGSDPKTIGKYVWPLMRSLYELNETVVSICLIVALVDYSLTFQ